MSIDRTQATESNEARSIREEIRYLDEQNALLKKEFSAMRPQFRELQEKLSGVEGVYAPLEDVRPYPNHYSYHTFPLLTEADRKRVLKKDVPVVCFGVDARTVVNGTYTLEIIVESNTENHTFKIPGADRAVHREVMGSFASWLGGNNLQHPVSLSSVIEALARIASKRKKDTPVFIKSPLLRYAFPLPKHGTEFNPDNLKDLNWLAGTFAEGVHAVRHVDVDQGNEQLYAFTIAGKQFEVLESGEMVFLMNNQPTIDLLHAAVKAGYISEAELDRFISLEDEMRLKQKTHEQYAAMGDVKGERKDLREGGWDTARPEYEYDPVRGLHYLAVMGEPVMDEFEKQYIQLLGANAAKYGGAVLEVGFGMGISACAVQEELYKHHDLKNGKPACHIIIEYNKEIAARAREWAKHQKVPVVILEGDWREQIQKIPSGILSGSLSDPYPLNPDEKHKDAALALTKVHDLLRPGGVSVHYSDSQYCLSSDHEAIAKAAGFKYFGSVTASFGHQLNTGEYFAQGLRMMIPALYKDGGTGTAHVLPQTDETKIRRYMRRLFVENPDRFRAMHAIGPRQESSS
jgi:hypothetical protein